MVIKDYSSAGVDYKSGSLHFINPIPIISATDPLAADVDFFMDVRTGQTSVSDEAGNYTFSGPAVNNISNSVQFFGEDSLSLNGSNEYLQLDPIEFSLPGDFNIEAWLHLTKTGENYIISRYVGGVAVNAWSMGVNTSNNRVFFFGGDTGAAAAQWDFPSIPTGTNIHVTIDRQGTSQRAFVDGVESTTGAVIRSTAWTSQNQFVQIGRFLLTNNSNGGYTGGYIGQLKVTQASRYQVPFTPVRLPSIS